MAWPRVPLREIAREARRRRDDLARNYPYRIYEVEWSTDAGWTVRLVRDLLEDGTVPMAAVTWPG